MLTNMFLVGSLTRKFGERPLMAGSLLALVSLFAGVFVLKRVFESGHGVCFPVLVIFPLGSAA